MNRSKKICALLGVLLAVCLAVFCVSRYEEHKEQIRNSEEIILEVNGEEATSLSWKYESEEFSFHKEDEWVYDEDEAFPVDQEKITKLLEQFEQFGVSFIIEDVEDYGQYGLEEPLCTIQIGTPEESYEIQLGNYSAMDSQRYVSVGDGNVYLAGHDPFEDFEIKISDLIKHDEIPDLTDAAGIQFTGAENYDIVCEEDSNRSYCKDDVYFTEQDGTDLPLDTINVGNYLQAVSSLNLTDYVSYNAAQEDLADWGLDEPELTVTVDYNLPEEEDGEKETDTFVLHVSRDPETRKKAEEEAEENRAEEESKDGEEEETTAYVRIGESKIIYRISGAEYAELMDVSRDTLRHQEIMSADFEDVTQIDVLLEGAEYAFTAKKEDEETVWSYQDQETDISGIRGGLAALTAGSFTGEEPNQKEEISLTVHLDNENFPQIQISLYRYDGSSCLAVVDGKPLALVRRSSVVDLVEAVHEIVLATEK